MIAIHLHDVQRAEPFEYPEGGAGVTFRFEDGSRTVLNLRTYGQAAAIADIINSEEDARRQPTQSAA